MHYWPALGRNVLCSPRLDERVDGSQLLIVQALALVPVRVDFAAASRGC